MKISHSANGFLDDSKYTADIQNAVLQNIGDLRIENINVNLIETFPYLNQKDNYENSMFSDDGLKCDINVTVFKAKDKNNKYTVIPSPKEVFQQLNSIIRELKSKHSIKFPDFYLDNNLNLN